MLFYACRQCAQLIMYVYYMCVCVCVYEPTLCKIMQPIVSCLSIYFIQYAVCVHVQCVSGCAASLVWPLYVVATYEPFTDICPHISLGDHMSVCAHGHACIH